MNLKERQATKKHFITIICILLMLFVTNLTACSKIEEQVNNNSDNGTKDNEQYNNSSDKNEKNTSVIVYNPYSTDNGNWFKGCTHFHINGGEKGGDDGKNTLEEMAAAFKENNYDFAFSTSHGRSNGNNEEVNGVMIYKGEEAVAKNSEVNLFGLEESYHDNEDESVSDVVKKFKDTKTLIQLNHPNREEHLKATTSNVLDYCKNGLWGIEMLNGGDYLEKTKLWDCALEKGMHLWATFGADAHKTENATRGWIVVNSKENTLDSILDSMKKGNFYCSKGETIKSISVKNNTVSLKLENSNCKVVWYDLNEKVLGEGLKYDITGKETYVRAVITNKDDKKSFAWTQPIFINKNNKKEDSDEKVESSKDKKGTPKIEIEGLTPSQYSVAEQIISVFENSSTTIKYEFAKDINDGQGITSGRAGFCTGTGDAYEVIKAYTKEVPDNVLAKYLDELKRLKDYGKTTNETDGILEIGDYCSDWKEACNDQKFKDIQDKFYHDMYYEPSRKEADKLGIQLPFTRVVLFDTAIQQGAGSSEDSLSGLIKKTNDKGTPQEVGEEKWLENYLEVRGELLKTERWKTTQYRTEILRQIYDDGNLDLSEPVVIDHHHFKGTIKAKY